MEKNKIKDAFNDGSGEYDNFRRNVIPLMDAFYNAAVELTQGFENPKILDLGAGTGILTELLHEAYPDSEITLMDMSSKMLELAKDKFKNITNFEYIEADYLTEDFGQKYDIVISSLSIHHLSDVEKQFLYRKIHDNLTEGGIFINADEVVGLTSKTEQMYKDKENGYLQRQNIPQKQKNILLERRKLDKPSTMLNNIKWFEEIGYKNVDVFYKYYRYFVIYGEK